MEEPTLEIADNAVEVESTEKVEIAEATKPVIINK